MVMIFLRKHVLLPLLTSLGFSFAGASAYGEEPSGRPIEPALEAHSPSGVFVDLLAAEFFEDRLRLSQSRRVEAETARRYLALSPADRAAFRAERKRVWRQMSDEEKRMLRGAKHPQFSNLTEAQKQPFRRIASRELGAVETTPVALLDSEI